MERVMYHFMNISIDSLEELKSIQKANENSELTYRETKKNGIVASIYGTKEEIEKKCKGISAKRTMRNEIKSRREDINARYWIAIQPGYCSMSKVTKVRAVNNFRD